MGLPFRPQPEGDDPPYRAPAGTTAVEDVLLDVKAGGCIEYLPEPRILFPEASLVQNVCLRLPRDAIALVTDGFVLRDPGEMQRPFRHYEAAMLVQRPDGDLLAADGIELAGPPCYRGKRTRFAAHDTMLLAADRMDACFETLSDEVSGRLGDSETIYSAAFSLPNGAGVAVRIAVTDSQALRPVFRTVHLVLRQYIHYTLKESTPEADSQS
jgi:urease accessory protein